MQQHIIAAKAAVTVLCIVVTVFGISIARSFLAHLNPAGVHVLQEMSFALLLVLGCGCAAALLRPLWVMRVFLTKMEAGHVL